MRRGVAARGLPPARGDAVGRGSPYRERFEPLGNALDPVGVLDGRALDGATPEQEAERLGELPQGFWDPQVAGEGEDGLPRPLRTLDGLLPERAPLRQDKAAQMWFLGARILPETLRDGPARLLTGRPVRHGAGPIAALGFEFRWDGMKAHAAGGDRALIVWGLTAVQVFQLYYHCPAEEWTRACPSSAQILETFEPLG